MNRLLLLLATACSAAAAAYDFGLAAAAEKQPGLSAPGHYSNVAQYGLMMCGIAYMGAKASSEARPDEPPPDKFDYRVCIATYKDATRKLYAAADKSLNKRQAREALKEHFVQVSLALSGIDPQPGEIRIDYQRRQAEAARKVEEAWTRFDLAK